MTARSKAAIYGGYAPQIFNGAEQPLASSLTISSLSFHSASSGWVMDS